MTPLANTACPLCGGANQCAPASSGSFETACWCTKAGIAPEALARVPPDLVDKAGLGPRCASGVADAAAVAPRPPAPRR